MAVGPSAGRSRPCFLTARRSDRASRVTPLRTLDVEHPKRAPHRLDPRDRARRARRGPPRRPGAHQRRRRERSSQSLFPPVAVTEQGAHIRDLYTIVFLVAAVIFFLVEGLIIWTVLRYRRKPGDDALPAQTHGNNIAEFIWTIVPTLIVAVLFVVSWQTLNVVDTATTAAGPQDPRGRRPVPVAVRLHAVDLHDRQGRQREHPAGAGSALQPVRARPAPTAAWSSRPGGPSSCT